MTTADPTTPLPLHIDVEIQRLGVVKPREQTAALPPVTWSFRTCTLDENGEPEF